MGRFADILGTLADGFRIGPKGAQALADMSGLTADRTFAFPDTSGTVMLDSQLRVPFLLTNGASSPIALTAAGKVPFLLAGGTPADIPLTT